MPPPPPPREKEGEGEVVQVVPLSPTAIVRQALAYTEEVRCAANRFCAEQAQKTATLGVFLRSLPEDVRNIDKNELRRCVAFANERLDVAVQREKGEAGGDEEEWAAAVEAGVIGPLGVDARVVMRAIAEARADDVGQIERIFAAAHGEPFCNQAVRDAAELEWLVRMEQMHKRAVVMRAPHA